MVFGRPLVMALLLRVSVRPVQLQLVQAEQDLTGLECQLTSWAAVLPGSSTQLEQLKFVLEPKVTARLGQS